MKADDPVETAVLELTEDPFTDDLNAELAARRRRPAMTRLTVGLGAVALAVACFAAGAQVQKSYGTPAAASAQQGPTGGYGFPGGAPGAQGAQGGQGMRRGQGQDPGTNPSAAAGASAGAAVTGTVKLVDGTTVYVELPDGTVLTVRTSDATTVRTAQPGSLKDLTVGSTVTVDGARSGESMNATTVTRAK
ncbi:hypothetical protein Val02_59810 [Virgisporangium aliadipatigenens]|uniref:DUF5666 domain-containing protein n=1 Tax=Virgisporangium aliadipatigenens TaxID=741659 RepID=A0A8J3YSE7_9ACTN|nr:hypothetical protein [Virgisporangium aliadipatigenens]GIJ49095.1 hypothetical protein Val02_59810 [Virgisporangium aliadipatigenens]